MSGSKHIDLICIAVTLCAILLTILFLNGEALGVTIITDGDSGDGQFTENDRRADWADDTATRITLTGTSADIYGSGAYADSSGVHIVYGGNYIVTGHLTDGSLVVDADRDDKVWIQMEDASIHCEDSAALLVEQAEKVFLTLADGTDNVLSSGEEYSQDAVSDGIDGTIYSRDDLTVNGSGSLTVTSGYRHAVVCNDDLAVTGGQIVIEAPQDGIHANDSARIAGADITITAGDDGVTVSNEEDTGYIYMESGNLTIPSCREGLEAFNITIAGGTVDISPSDDGFNASGTGENAFISISGGDIRIVNPTGRDADGLDSNGSIFISGGNILVSVNGTGGNCALDCGTEGGGVCEISGGTVIAAGGSAMASGFDSSSEQCFIMHNTETAVPDNTEVTLTGSDGEVLLSGTVPCGFSSLILSSPGLQLGDTCTLLLGDTETEITVDNSSVAAAFGRGGMGHGMGMRAPGADGAAQAENARGGRQGRKPFDTQDGTEPGVRPERMPDQMTGQTPDWAPDQAPGQNPDWAPDQAPGQNPDWKPDQAPGQMTDQAPDQMPGQMRGQMTGRMQARGNRAAQVPAADPLLPVLAGVSGLVLLAGIAAAVRKKSLW